MTMTLFIETIARGMKKHYLSYMELICTLKLKHRTLPAAYCRSLKVNSNYGRAPV